MAYNECVTVLNSVLLLLGTEVTRAGATPKVQCKDSYDNAKNVCALSHQQLRLPVRNYDESIWVPIKKHDLGQWEGIDGLFYAQSIVKPESRIDGQDCAVLRSQDRIIDEMYCNKKTLGFICHQKDSSICPMEAECVRVNGQALAVFWDEISWFDAFARCKKQNSSLAAFPEPTFRGIKGHLRTKINRQGHFAIGLVRSYWYLDHQMEPHQKPEVLQTYRWKLEEPVSTKTCAVQEAGSDSWRSASCSEQHAFVCTESSQAFGASDQSTAPLTTESIPAGCPVLANTSTSEESLGTGTVIIITLLALISVLLFLILIRPLWKNRKKREVPTSLKEKALLYRAEEDPISDKNEIPSLAVNGSEYPDSADEAKSTIPKLYT